MAKDRCDRCGARAYVRALLANGELLFCAHHARQAGPSLRAQALQVDDFSADLLRADR
jgi:4-hydroxyphenylpyruvate dioxygenase-like putative hemolysin